MTLKTLADEYFEEAQRLRKRIYELRNLEEEATGQDLYNIRRKIMIYNTMANDCMKTSEYLGCYYDERGIQNENRFHRQRFVGLHYAMSYPLKCFVLRACATDWLEPWKRRKKRAAQQ